ncbi:FixH family protein [Marinobacter sp. DUT-1]|uniref:FixH family protein n=1 Tax=Marinobacter sp. DUT-1 TaxID=3412037 RepID=UPI003D16D6E7
MSEHAPVAPWYRQPWFWFLTIFPLAAIIWCTVMIVVASNMKDTMVTDDYSKEGRGINLAIARDQQAYDMGMVGEMSFEKREVTLKLNTEEGPAQFPYVVLKLFHPTLAERDRTIQFRNEGGGYYSGTMLNDIEGRWYYDLQGPDNTWRLKGEAWLPSEDGLTIRAEKPVKG